MKLTIFGTGYAGLVTGTCLAQVGHDVLCIDIDKEKISSLQNGVIPIYEPGLEELVKRNVAAGRLQFSTDAELGVKHGVAIFNAVGTPPDRDNASKADLKYVKAVAETFGKYITEYKVFINKSTVPVGTAKLCSDIIKREIYARKKDIDYDVASNPEFLREGTAVTDFLSPDRIVLGCETTKARDILEEIYRPFERTHTEILFTSLESSELIKYAANSFLATKISFINEIANFSEHVGADILDVAKGLGLDPRIGRNFLSAGVGYGGSCLPKDVKALIESGKEFGYDFQIITAADEVNEKQKNCIVTKLQSQLGELKNIKIAIWGLAFKPETDDVREAVSGIVIEKLLSAGVYEIRAYDPIAIDMMKKFGPQDNRIIYTESYYDTLDEVDALLLLTEWDEFYAPDWKRISKTMKGNLIIDGRNIWNRKIVERYGFNYIAIGR
ncbi:UDP-glucose/GDP-mannose dehydrogenase family protein [Candidatus Gracilibacteria bacterium]|nr:UDP-glucose/GDP-mannose dehydrogenase family protein [Candidatus Gracilibacteria bacterium]